MMDEDKITREMDLRRRYEAAVRKAEDIAWKLEEQRDALLYAAEAMFEDRPYEACWAILTGGSPGKKCICARCALQAAVDKADTDVTIQRLSPLPSGEVGR